MSVRRWMVAFAGVLVFGAFVSGFRQENSFTVSSVVSFLDHVLWQAAEHSIETCTFVGTNESFLQEVIDQLAVANRSRLAMPIFNNLLPKAVPRKQLVIVAGDDIDSLMKPNFLSENSRNIYAILVLSDMRYLQSNRFILMRSFFGSDTFLIVTPPPTKFQSILVTANDYAGRLVILQPNESFATLFADRFASRDLPRIYLLAQDTWTRIWQNEAGLPAGPDWSVFHAILEHLNVRWHIAFVPQLPSEQAIAWINDQLDGDMVHIFINRGFRPDDRSVAHMLPEMAGVCLVVPRTAMFNILHHLLKPFRSTSWIVLAVLLLVGTLLTNRYFPHTLIDALIFVVPLDAPRVTRTERTALFASLCLFFILSEAYQAKLVAHMTSFRYPPDPRTIDEFLQTDIMLQVTGVTAEALMARPDFREHLQTMPIGRIDYKLDGTCPFGVLLQCTAARALLEQELRDQYERHGHIIRPPVHIVEEKLMTVGNFYSFSNYFRLYPLFRRYLVQLFESGLVGYWERRDSWPWDRDQGLRFVESNIITFNDLLMVWAMLGIGHGVAIVLFVLELVVHAVKRRFQSGRPIRCAVAKMWRAKRWIK
ncbi:hypothetical protein AND_000868 [Anopheles darlingi]|uniref:Ionotropic receptor n=1 Tax=Anopheles darlingi TaxID=43151 RepID=W5JSG4_ANODA|nr:hypothetical protein AND_000868 [Anopheles darlingi]